MTGYVLVLVVALLALGCSKKKEESEGEADPSVKGRSSKNLPAKDKRNLSHKEDLERRVDGLWYKDGAPFEGVAVTRFNSGEIEWEETYKKGVRVGVKGWDEDGELLELFSWGKDGKPLHQRP